MGCRILEDCESGECAFYCSTTGVAFGPVLTNRDVAEKFCAWIPGDPRNYAVNALLAKYGDFVQLYVCECGVVREDQCSYCDDCLPRSADGREHMWMEDGESYRERCLKDPEPVPGERFRCASCQRKDARKAAKRKVASA